MTCDDARVLSDLDDGHDCVQSHDGRWAWVDTDYDGPGTRVVEWVGDREYAYVDCNISGVLHVQIAELDASDGEPVPSADRSLWSSHWYDISEMR